MHTITERDWQEDFQYENGNYQNICADCGTLFIGHKKRYVCKVCVNDYAKELAAMTKEDREKHENDKMREAVEWFNKLKDV